MKSVSKLRHIQEANARLELRHFYDKHSSVLTEQTTVVGGGSSTTQSTTINAAATQTNQIIQVQKKLGVAADGKWGPASMSALKAWQQKNGLTADGIIGPLTLKKMGL